MELGNGFGVSATDRSTSALRPLYFSRIGPSRALTRASCSGPLLISAGTLTRITPRSTYTDTETPRMPAPANAPFTSRARARAS